MISVCAMRCGLCLLLPAMLSVAQALTLDFKSITLSTDQRASLKRFLADSSPALSFDWKSLEAHSHSIGRERNPLSVSLSTVPALTAAGICRSEQHHFHEAGKGRWLANDELTSLQAWPAPGADCALPSAPVGVDKSLTDAEFLIVDRDRLALLKRAAPVIGGSDCARVLHCQVVLRRINRVQQENPPRILTRLTFSPSKPGPACLYVMEVSFVGPLNDLAPLGASCPMP